MPSNCGKSWPARGFGGHARRAAGQAASGGPRVAVSTVHRPDRSGNVGRAGPRAGGPRPAGFCPGEAIRSSAAKARLLSLIEADILVAGPIQPRAGRRHLVALVGPTGVGKTTTIAKLAANYRLRERLRVGLITVDTYRIAAVEQLRTYADIIDLPMEVVSTPREMRQAVARLADLDLVLMDTAGRCPRDEVKNSGTASRCWPKPGPTKCTWCSVASPARPALAKNAERFAVGRHHRVDPDQARRGHWPGQLVAALAHQPAAGQLFDQRAKRARRHRSRRVRPTCPPGPGTRRGVRSLKPRRIAAETEIVSGNPNRHEPRPGRRITTAGACRRAAAPSTAPPSS